MDGILVWPLILTCASLLHCLDSCIIIIESGMYAFLFLPSFLFEPCALSVISFIFPIKIKPRQWALSIPSSQRNLQRPRECSVSEHCKLLSDLRPTRALLEGATYCSINLMSPSPSLSSVSILEPLSIACVLGAAFVALTLSDLGQSSHHQATFQNISPQAPRIGPIHSSIAYVI